MVGAVALGWAAALRSAEPFCSAVPAALSRSAPSAGCVNPAASAFAITLSMAA